MNSHLAIDIGASSGRVMASWLEEDSMNNSKLRIEEVYRFKNMMHRKEGHLIWDIDYLYFSIIKGIKEAVRLHFNPVTIGIDTWGVDYVLLDKNGSRLSDPIAYRDSRTNGMMEEVIKVVPKEMIYERTGIQFQSFNTLYQLMALKKQNSELLNKADFF